MSTWDELRAVVDELRDDPRRPLRGVSGLVGERHAVLSFRVSLAAWAVEIAESLDERFGPEVSITVGALHFPDRTFRDPTLVVRDPRSPEHFALLSPEVAAVAVDGELKLRSGFDERCSLDVQNRSDRELAIRTNGNLTARVVDPASGEVVGGFTGAQTMAGVVFHVAPGDTTTVPLLVGTTSLVPELGYAIPPGQWAIEAVVDLGEGGRFLTPRLAITVMP